MFADHDACFVWCDIDGHGKKWRLAISREMEDEDERGVYFPFEDFHDYAENFEKCPQEPVAFPKQPPESK